MLNTQSHWTCAMHTITQSCPPGVTSLLFFFSFLIFSFCINKERQSEIDGYYGNITQSRLCLWHLGEQLITRGEHTGRTDLHNQRNQFSFSAPQRLITSWLLFISFYLFIFYKSQTILQIYICDYRTSMILWCVQFR